jgi:predicted alpha/beta hydrolase family esterase
MAATQQILSIHGGNTFPNHEAYLEFLRTKELTLERLRHTDSWKDTLQSTLGARYDVFAPRMPNGMNAVYAEWELYFSRILALMSDELILIGHSLGGVFLARYLSEHRAPIRIRATFFVAAPYSEKGLDETLGEFVAPTMLALLEEQGGKIIIYQSTDDPVVPFAHGESYAKALPQATFRVCEGLGHFNVPSFPALVEDIRTLGDGVTL